MQSIRKFFLFGVPIKQISVVFLLSGLLMTGVVFLTDNNLIPKYASHYYPAPYFSNVIQVNSALYWIELNSSGSFNLSFDLHSRNLQSNISTVSKLVGLNTGMILANTTSINFQFKLLPYGVNAFLILMQQYHNYDSFRSFVYPTETPYSMDILPVHILSSGDLNFGTLTLINKTRSLQFNLFSNFNNYLNKEILLTFSNGSEPRTHYMFTSSLFQKILSTSTEGSVYLPPFEIATKLSTQFIQLDSFIQKEAHVSNISKISSINLIDARVKLIDSYGRIHFFGQGIIKDETEGTLAALNVPDYAVLIPSTNNVQYWQLLPNFFKSVNYNNFYPRTVSLFQLNSSIMVSFISPDVNGFYNNLRFWEKSSTYNYTQYMDYSKSNSFQISFFDPLNITHSMNISFTGNRTTFPRLSSSHVILRDIYNTQTFHSFAYSYYLLSSIPGNSETQFYLTIKLNKENSSYVPITDSVTQNKVLTLVRFNVSKNYQTGPIVTRDILYTPKTTNSSSQLRHSGGINIGSLFLIAKNNKSLILIYFDYSSEGSSMAMIVIWGIKT